MQEGIILQATAGQLAQLVLGVVITGLGLGIMYQAVLLEDAEIAPTNKRGMFVSLWQLGDQAGYALSNGIFLFPSIFEKTYGWRLALSTALWPAVAIILLLPWLPETPSSLIQRGLLQEGMESLQRIRGPWYGSEALAAEMQLIWKAAGRPHPDTNRVARFSWLTSQLKQLFSQEQLPQLMVVTLLTVLAWLQDLISKQLLVAAIYMPAKRNLRLALSLLPLAEHFSLAVRSAGLAITSSIGGFVQGEDQQAVVNKRYRVPMMSVRDALHDIMHNPNNRHNISGNAMLVDRVHTSNYGALVYASFLAWAVRHQVTMVLRHHRQHMPLEVAAAHQWPLPPSLLPAKLKDDERSFCADGLSLKQYVVDSQGFQFTDEGSDKCVACHKYGHTAVRAGSTLTLRVNSDVLDAHDKNNCTEVVVKVSILRSYAQVGRAKLECVSGCHCDLRVIDAAHEHRTSELKFQSIPITPAPECMLKFTVLDETSTEGHKFWVSAVAIHKASNLTRMAFWAPPFDH
eukprot:gene12559-12691_t